MADPTEDNERVSQKIKRGVRLKIKGTIPLKMTR